ncbi:MAG: rhodanese-like domain-containing protein [Lachnospiraceae bacterium]|nr:rhodanese-like domain-containing protein [Lachnospiraceae bacterium]
MGLLDRFTNKKDINEYLREFRAEQQAVLIDVREKKEFAAGHIPRSRSIPLAQIEKSESSLPDKNVPLYVYCEKGGRSAKACEKLRKMGYTRVINIGGIEKYTGKREGGGAKNRTVSNMKAQAIQKQKQEPWNKGMPKVR